MANSDWRMAIGEGQMASSEWRVAKGNDFEHPPEVGGYEFKAG